MSIIQTAFRALSVRSGGYVRSAPMLLLTSMLATTYSSAWAADLVSKAQKSVAGTTSQTAPQGLQGELDTLKAQPVVSQPPVTRAQIQAQKAERFFANSDYSWHSFGFYDAFARLFDDVDRDGFHSTFSVTFDADLYASNPYEQVWVYGELYLSRNGGDWIHYYTTDPFVITGSSPNDDYEVLTTLERGYRPGDYDVLIDLYEVGYSDAVATISSLETDDLYGLPLESLDWDDWYESDSSGHGGGSLGGAVLLGLSLLYWRRRTQDE
ncbi:choice-of-anchor H family protein [Shewanella sp. GXUN23E]|uniref:choice-of-anchor H family protein n=1 Tax=Shewanella sp. GXUN23E TaxID=3422498 RepID=UPI003D7DD2CB